MGNCFGGGSDPGTSTNKAANTDLKNRQKEMSREIKLLLLGSGESGKSTVFKQVKILYNEGYTQDDILLYKASIYANIITTIKALAESCVNDGIPFENPENEKRAQSMINLAESETSLLLNADKKYDEKMAGDVEALWADATIKKQFERRYEFHVFDGATYFFSNLPRLRPPLYMPSNEDILHCRRKTTGIVEVKFDHDGYTFKLCDVGGYVPTISAKSCANHR